MKHRILISVISLFFILSSLPRTFAQKVELPVNCKCVTEKYTVYGDDQPKEVNKGECFVSVDMEKNLIEKAEQAPEKAGDFLSKNQPAKAPEITGKVSDTLQAPAVNVALGLRELILGPIKSVGAPFAAVFKSIAEKSPLKKLFSEMMQILYQNHTEQYHEFLDEEVFGNAIRFVSQHDTIEKLEEAIEKEKATVKNDPDHPHQCSNNDPRPECVIQKAFCSYEKYLGVLFEEAGGGRIDRPQEELQAALETLKKRDAALVQEAQDSQVALDTAIAVYSNFFKTYQMHLKFKDVISALVKVRNRSSYLLDLVSCIPNKFVGVATTTCD